jgi:hypothetical protein
MNTSEKRDELIDDIIDKLRKLGQKWNDRLTLDNRRFSERYLKGQIEVTVHGSRVTSVQTRRPTGKGRRASGCCRSCMT